MRQRDRPIWCAGREAPEGGFRAWLIHCPAGEWTIRREGACDLVLLTNPRFILKPDLHRRPALFYADGRNQIGGVSFESLVGFGVLRVVLRAGGEAAEPHGAELPSHRLAADADAELFSRPLDEVEQPLPDDAVEIRLLSFLDRIPQQYTLFIGQTRWRSRPLAIDQPVRSFRVEPQHPVTNDLEANAGQARGVAAPAPIVNLRQR